jgi:predicted NBD/HSP70 family sugar kinase
MRTGTEQPVPDQPAAGSPRPGGDGGWAVVGIDNGGNTNNATVLDSAGRFLIDGLLETPSRVLEGPAVAVEAMAEALENVLSVTGISRSSVRAVGLDTPGPASATGVISSRGSTNFSDPAWFSFDIRSALQQRTGLPVVYSNDANAAALYAHHLHFGPVAGQRSSVSAIVGTGLGGGIVEAGTIISGAAGMAGELGHVHIPMQGLLDVGQPIPQCNCGFAGDAESVASLSGIANNLLPYWLTRYPGHPLASEDIRTAAKLVRTYGERGDELALRIFEQQAMAIGRLFTIAANFTDPNTYFLGGGVVETTPDFRDWFLGRVRAHTHLRAEQLTLATFALVPERDMAGARGSAIAALGSLQTSEGASPAATGAAEPAGENTR